MNMLKTARSIPKNSYEHDAKNTNLDYKHAKKSSNLDYEHAGNSYEHSLKQL